MLASLAQAERAAEQATSLRDELAYVESSLRTSAASMLEGVRIATPCRERWEDMAGDDVVRHCARCRKDVYDLASMTTAEAEALLARDGETPCVRFRRRRDGRVVTSDCPPPSWSERTGARLATAGAAAAVAIAGGVVAAHAFPDEPACAAPAPASMSRGLPWLEEPEHESPAVMGAVAPPPRFEVSETTLGIGWPSTIRFVPSEAADGSAGVKVFGVHPRSALAAMGLSNGDLLLQIERTRTTTPADVVDAMATLQRERGAMFLELERRGQRLEHFVVVVSGTGPRF